MSRMAVQNSNSNRTREPLATETATASNVRRSSRKRSRQQYAEDQSDEADESPIRKRQRKGRKGCSDDEYTPTCSMAQEYSNEDDDDSSDAPIVSHSNSNRNRNVRNTNAEKKSEMKASEQKTPYAGGDDALAKIGTFELKDDEGTPELAQRDVDYQYASYSEYKKSSAARLQGKHVEKAKGAGACHRDVSDRDWFKNPRDHKKRRRGEPGYDPSQILLPPRHITKKYMTNAQRQYWELKQHHFDGILFFKVGKFYELYYIDADIGHKICGLAYMSGETPHVGFPETSYMKFAECFVHHGYKVYRVEQTETTTAQKERGAKIVRRELCEVLSKGTLVPEELLADAANHVVCVVERVDVDTKRVEVAVCAMDFSTGKVQVGRFGDDRNRSRLRTMLFQLAPSELVYGRGDALSAETLSLLKMDAPRAAKTQLIIDEQLYAMERTQSILDAEKYWDVGARPAVLQTIWNDALQMQAVGGILHTLIHTMHDQEILPHSAWATYDPRLSEYLTLDGSTLRNLEILTNEEGTRRGTLFEFVNKCKTKFGRRRLEKWLRAPLNRLDAINARLDAVGYLIDHIDEWADRGIFGMLAKLPDLERLLLNLAVLGTKNRMMDKAVIFDPGFDEAKIMKLMQALDGFENADALLSEIRSLDIEDKLLRTLCCELPDFAATLKEFCASFDRAMAEKDKIIQPKRGFNTECDDVLDALDENEEKLDAILEDARRQFGSRGKGLKWWHAKNATKIEKMFNIEVPKSAGITAPLEWHLRTETKSVERYQTDGIVRLLKVRQDLSDQKERLLRDAARACFAKFAAHGATWRRVVDSLATLDCLLSLAEVSASHVDIEMTRPEFVELKDGEPALLDIRECVHPQLIGNKEKHFVPNDIVIGGEESSFVMVTGPNMGGKSTLLRQTCVAVVLAHMGCWVPCSKMRLSVVDRIFTRVGANDRILSGQSTFMVELEETANILEHATPNSLVILDELGRGTSTFDGTAIAYAVAMDLIDAKKCRALFSTHYHGLCQDFGGNDKVAMYHMAFAESGEAEDGTKKITFLYKFVPGVCDQSHGINCARMAGLPMEMLSRAKEKAERLQNWMHVDHTRDVARLETQFEGLMKGLLGVKGVKLFGV